MRTTKEGKEIDINTYDDINHLRNIGKHCKIIGYNIITIDELRKEIIQYIDDNNYLNELRELAIYETIYH